MDATNELRKARVSAPLDGIHKDVGSAYDLVLGIEEWKHLEVELVFGRFRAGSAYGDLSGRDAWNGELKVDYNF